MAATVISPPGQDRLSSGREIYRQCYVGGVEVSITRHSCVNWDRGVVGGVVGGAGEAVCRRALGSDHFMNRIYEEMLFTGWSQIWQCLVLTNAEQFDV